MIAENYRLLIRLRRELAELYQPLQLDDDTTDATREAESAHRDHPKLSASAPLIWPDRQNDVLA